MCCSEGVEKSENYCGNPFFGYKYGVVRKWKNWAGNVVAQPQNVHIPASEAELVGLVEKCARESRKVKVPGSGHSFTATAAPVDQMILISHFSGIISIDRARSWVTVGAGTVLSDLNRLLHDEGLALPNLGDIAYQTVAGAISTSTHGTGRGLPGLAGQVRGFRLVTATGQVLDCSSQSNPHIFALGRVSVGALGVITQYTLEVVEAFRLHAHEVPMKLDDVLSNWNELTTTNDHFEFFWIPHTKWALTKRNNRTDKPLDPLPTVRGWFEKTFMENVAFGAVCHLGKFRPNLIPKLATALPGSGDREYIDQSFKIFASPRLVHFYEMEHALPIDSLVPALRDVVSMVERKGYKLNFPVEVRATAADDVALSTSYGRDSAYIAVHIFRGMEYEPFFRDVEDIMRQYGARPHWGKIHHREKEELMSLYPRFGEFLELRDQLDPERMFENRYTRQVFGE
jgi:FAD-linked oxidoreductase